MLAALLALMTPAVAGDCATPVELEELEAAVAHAEAAMADLDEAAFHDRAGELVGVLLPCAADPVPPPLAAQTHLVMALHLFTNGDEPRAHASMRAAHRVDPDVVAASTLIPEVHPLREGLDLAPVATRKVPQPLVGSVSFDGRHDRLRPRGVPSLLQLTDSTGFVVETRWLDPRAPLPEYRAVPRKRNALIACGGAGLVLGTGVFTGAWLHRTALVAKHAADPEAPSTELDAHRARVNVLHITASGLFGVGVGCGVGAALIGEQ